MKPILFNSDMVRAIIDGRKTQTRRVCKISTVDGEVDHNKCNYVEYPERNYLGVCANFYDGLAYMGAAKPMYQKDDILYVRETWAQGCTYSTAKKYYYRADGETDNVYKWHPSIHMPKEAARIFLRVTNVCVERLQEITPEEAVSEGVGNLYLPDIAYGNKDYGCEVDDDYGLVKEQFAHLWDSTIKKSDLPRYGWDANPWVWVYELERIDR